MSDDVTTRLNDGEDLEIAHPEDFGVARDDSGDLQPLQQRIPGTDKAVLVKPMVGGAAERYDDVLNESNADDERVEDLLNEFIVEGIGSSADLDRIPDFLVPGLIQAIRNASGMEVFRAVEEQQLREDMAAIEALDGMGDMEGLFEKAMEKAAEEGEASSADKPSTS